MPLSISIKCNNKVAINAALYHPFFAQTQFPNNWQHKKVDIENEIVVVDVVSCIQFTLTLEFLKHRISL